MARRDLLIGLDLGSYAFRMVAARRDPANPDGGIELLAGAEVPARGVRRGMIVSVDEAASAVNLLRTELERKIGEPIHDAAVSLGGTATRSFLSQGLIVVSRTDNRIGEEDVQRVLDAAGAVNLSTNHEVIDVFPRTFTVDGETGIRDALGMQGRRLETQAVVFAAHTPHLKSLRNVFLAGEMDIATTTPAALAASAATLTARPKELGVGVVNIGHGTTDLAVYEEGDLLGTAAVPVGGGHITNDIAIGMRTSIDAAERAKHEHGSVAVKDISKREKIDLGTLDPAQEGESFSRRELAEIMEARVEEIFELVNDELHRMERARLLPSGIVLTGGSANIPGIVDVARRKFRLPVSLGYPMLVHGPKEVVSSLAYTTALGLVLLGAEADARTRRRRSRLFRGFSLGRGLKNLAKRLLP